MKKEHHQIDVQASSPAEMRVQIKKNEAQIANLSSSIKKQRIEMKKFSQQMTKLLQKKLITKNPSHQTHPNFNPQFSNPRNQSLYSQKQSIYLEIAKLKQEISELLSQQQPEVVNEIRKKQSVLQQLTKEEAERIKQKQMLQEALNENKIILEDYKQSQCLKQIQQNEKQLEQIKTKSKQLDKDMKNWMNEEIAMSIYQASVNKHIQQMEAPQGDVDQVDDQVVNQMVQQIRRILQERKILDREHLAKKQEIGKKIQRLIEENSSIEKQIRQITNQKLKKHLQMKKKELISRNKSLPQIAGIQRQSIGKRVFQNDSKEKDHHIPSLLLTQPKEPNQKKVKKVEKPKQQLSTVIIGNWRPQNHIKDDIIKTRNIARAIFMKIRTKDKKITGIGVTYIDKIGVEVLGRSNIWKMTEDQKEQGEEEFTIDLQDVVGLYYYSSVKATESPSTSSAIIGLKFMSKSSRPVIKIGEFLNEEEVEFINLQNRFIKTVQFTLDNSYKSISGIKLSLFDIGQPQKSVVFEADPKDEESIDHAQPMGLKNEIKNEEMMPSKWLSTTSQAGLTQKKVFIKQAYSKKLNDVPQVDHRLMLNRKKKMV